MSPARVLCWALVAALAAGAAGAAERRNHWQLHFGFDVVHDSNVLDLSKGDRAQVEDPLRSDRQGLESADDWISHPDLEFTWSRNIAKRKTTSITAGVGGFVYAANSRLSRGDWSLEFDQELSKKRRPTASRIGLSLSTSPQVTLKRIIDDDETLAQGMVVRADQEYDQDALVLDGRVELMKEKIALDLDLSRRWRDYIPTFDERDGTLDEWQAALVGHPSGHWRLRGAYAKARYDGVGDDPSTPLAEDDISSDRETFILGARFEWGKKGARQRVQAGWEQETRDFTAKNPFDFYHYLRTDTRTTWAFSWRRSLPHDLAVEVSFEDVGNRSRYEQPPPTINPAEDETDYDTTSISAGISWRYDL